MGRPATAKKDRLINAAMRRYHHNGIAASSIAAVARDADVPAGNVYYYFRSKDSLTEAVVERLCERVAVGLALHEAHPDPLDRLRSFITSAGDRRQSYTDHGCPLAAIAGHSGRPLALVRAWLAAQFAALDRASALGRADFSMASLQGSFALAHATGDPAVVANCVEQLLDWIEGRIRPI
ncbi:MAG: TetR/AcrR family transcriptional regulator [Sphingomicrobium sp.]